MTRTSRSVSPRALLKDRSEARNGMDTSLPKGGAGAHNWGTFELEADYQADALADEAAEFEDQVQETGGAPGPASVPKKPIVVRRTSSVTDEDRENALKVRKNALKSGNDIDLAAIARSSVAVSGSPPKSSPITSSVHVSRAAPTPGPLASSSRDLTQLRPLVIYPHHRK
ncbi:hypothetical protein BC834DRAFT_835282 [Gloeopeniophorella convolvens]|nr:hypothetical protein BC834DRAFT_835282 [Gloeopeniophorella convolvens]